jgi:hypothetical protein
MEIIAYHILDKTIYNSRGESCDSNYLDFLLQQHDDIKVFYNLDWAVARLMYLLNIPENLLRRFWTTSKLYWNGYSIFFVPHRYLAIEYGKHWGKATFSDVFQYDINLKYDANPNDAVLDAVSIGYEVQDTLDKLGITSSSLSSPVSAYQKTFLNNRDLPTWEDNPDEVNEYAYQCMSGGWQECFKKGHYDAVWDFDMTSAYSFETMNLTDTRYGEWIHSTKFYPYSEYGFWKGVVQIDSDFSPIIFKGSTATTPNGEFQRYLTTNQILQLYKYKIGRFKLIDGWYWTPDKIEYPLKEDIEILFDWKQNLKGLQKDIVKRILVGIWGKTGEIFGDSEFGKLFNPVWATMTETSVLVKVADFVLSNKAQDNVISIAVDGCTFDKEIILPQTDAIGSWRLNTVAPGYFISSGISTLKGKQSKGNFTLKYEWLEDQIKQNPEANEYIMSKKVPVTLGYALSQHKLDKLGELELKSRSVIIDYEIKRQFTDLPKNGRDLQNNHYESKACDISLIKFREFFT